MTIEQDSLEEQPTKNAILIINNRYLPVVFHNSQGYDSHIISQAIGNVKTKEPEVVAKNLEEYVFFKIGNLHFIDSLQFLNAI